MKKFSKGDSNLRPLGSLGRVLFQLSYLELDLPCGFLNWNLPVNKCSFIFIDTITNRKVLATAAEGRMYIFVDTWLIYFLY